MRSFFVPLLFGVVGCGSPGAQLASPHGARREGVRPLVPLSLDVRPTRYALSLRIVPTEESFAGTVTIDVELREARRSIELHGRDLQSVHVRARRGDAWEEGRYVQHPDGLAVIDFARPLGPGMVPIEMTYRAPFAADLDGLYRVTVGPDRYAFTQFEPMSARKAFPCFDEPFFKTPFDITLTVPASGVAVSNELVVAERPTPDGLRTLRFATTGPLPTYLVAFAVGPLDVVEGEPIVTADVRSGTLPFRAFTARGRGREIAHAMDVTRALLPVLEGYFGIPYPYRKLDILAVPDFGAGGMENAATIFYADRSLLLDPRTASIPQQRSVALLIAHELAHQWFGNLVTMRYWDDLWLNEGFASWMESRAVDMWQPALEPRVSGLEWAIEAMDADSLASARQVREPIRSTHDVFNAFDDITYGKGAAVLGMFEQWIGPGLFRESVHQYLTTHADGNARTEDFLAVLSETSGRDVSGPLRSFLEQPGVPLVRIDVHCERTTGTVFGIRDEELPTRATVLFEQTRFAPVGGAPSAGRWEIPVCFRYEVDADLRNECTLLTEASADVVLGSCPSWLMPNVEGAGYYRWTLGGEWLNQLFQRAYGRLTVTERISVADALWAGFSSGALSAERVLGWLPALAHDRSRAVAVRPMGMVRWIRNAADPADRSAMDAWARRLYGPSLARLGWQTVPGEPSDDRELRAEVIGFMSEMGDQATQEHASRLGAAVVAAILEGRDAAEVVPEEWVGRVLVAAAGRSGDAALFGRMLAAFERTSDARERRQLLDAIGSFSRPELAHRARELTFDARLRVNERLAPVGAQLHGPASRPAAWVWLRARLDRLRQELPPDWAGSLPLYLAGACDETSAVELQETFGPVIGELAGGPRNLETAIESVRLCAALRQAQGPAVHAFFTSQAAQ